MPMIRRLAAAALPFAAILVMAPPSALAQSFYSIQTNSDELVIVDASSGDVRVVGPLGMDVRIADLAIAGGVLVGSVRVPGAPFEEFVTIDTSTGAVLTRERFTVRGVEILRVEGLAADPATGTIYVGYSADGDNNSESLGTCTLTGEINPIAVTSPVYDIDGLTALEFGSDPHFVAVDRKTGPAIVTFARLDEFGRVMHIADRPFDATISGTDDLAFADGRVWSMDFTTNMLVSLDPATGDVVDAAFNPAFAGLFGLAAIVSPPCPADLDGDGELTLFDFLEFQNLFDAGDPIADFDGDGELTIFDFLAFQNAFDAGCP